MYNSLKKIIRRKIKPLVLWYYKGTKYTCPFCGYKSRTLKSVGVNLPVMREKEVVGGLKRKGRCFQCNAKDREKLVYLYLKNEFKLFSSTETQILHIAPEPHLSTKLLAQGFDKYVCGDLFDEGYVYPAHVQNIDVTRMPFSDDSFDLIICNHVLEHIPDDALAMRELVRVLRPSGIAILQVPISLNAENTYEDFSITDPRERTTAFGQRDHVRIYGQDYFSRLEKAGFKVNQLELALKYINYGVNPREKLFVCQVFPKDQG